MSTRRQIYPVNRSALPQTRQRHEEHPTMPTDISSRRPRPANHTSSLAPGLNNFSPHGNSVQRQSNATMDVWSGNYGLAPAYYANTYGSEMGMNYYYTLGTLSDESSPANVPNALQPNRAGSSRSDHRREPADIDLR
ncbi:hypothetical protein N7533_011062 [Penicillium manginii]|jgi:hypothetical protein|uniref:uncharacterized protein n=1 Tax=Penicillium manginii TaxID=203109 RepID=UPI002546E1B0|nr:uncharacterized protein N7533_011062 [Penicillium manginii]KAJ5741653.1 hypothetical protein N7533_011062 [Penicillium manginii]